MQTGCVNSGQEIRSRLFALPAAHPHAHAELEEPPAESVDEETESLLQGPGRDPTGRKQQVSTRTRGRSSPGGRSRLPTPHHQDAHGIKGAPFCRVCSLEKEGLPVAWQARRVSAFSGIILAESSSEMRDLMFHDGSRASGKRLGPG